MQHSALLLSALVGLALASPVVVEKRQDIDFAAYDSVPFVSDIAAPPGDAAPQTVTYDAGAVISSAAAAATGDSNIVLAKKAAVVCTTRSYNGPQVTTPTDSPNAFLANAAFSSAALAATSAGAVPTGYAVVPGFVNLKGSAQDSHYLTYTMKNLHTYDPKICAADCDAMTGCMSFNIYYERDPLIVSPITQVPDANSCPGTSTSPSATLLKCAFYGGPISASQATNVGQYQGKFHLVIAGSNAYIKSTAPTLDGYQGPVNFNNAAINAPAPVNKHGYLRVQTFGQSTAFLPSACAASCQEQTDYNAQHPYVGGPCVFFDAYMVYRDGVNPVFTCVYYSTPYNISYATNVGQYGPPPASHHYTIAQSYGYYVDGNYV